MYRLVGRFAIVKLSEPPPRVERIFVSPWPQTELRSCGSGPRRLETAKGFAALLQGEVNCRRAKEVLCHPGTEASFLGRS